LDNKKIALLANAIAFAFAIAIASDCFNLQSTLKGLSSLQNVVERLKIG